MDFELTTHDIVSEKTIAPSKLEIEISRGKDHHDNSIGVLNFFR